MSFDYRAPMHMPLAGSQGAREALRWDSAAIWIVGVVLFQFACQIGLLVLGSTPLRLPLRMGAFGVSLCMLLLFPRRSTPHPSYRMIVWILLILCLGIVHPERNSLIASVAQIAMYLAILAPLIWVAGFQIDAAVFRRLVLCLWAFYSLSAAFGVLQTRFPQLQPEISAIYQARGQAAVESNLIILTSGRSVFRPMGLTDTPGGAAIGGFYAIVLGLGLLVSERGPWLKLMVVGSMAAGLFCIYLSQVRSILVMVGICIVAFGFVLAWRREWARLMWIGGALAAIIFVSTIWAVLIGGEMTLNRLRTLVEEDPATVYYHNRGHFLHRTWEELLPRYPFGAGLARWGMINYYFGDDDPDTEALWAEIQWTAWLYDGGVLLIVAYSTAVGIALWTAWKIAITPPLGWLSMWAAVIFAYDVGALAVTFNSPIFMSQAGMDFWLLNASLFAAWQYSNWRAQAQRRACNVT